jgi:hypothetical protein
MCCSVSPGVRVEFSDTVLYAAEVIDARGEVVHVLAYQNKARNASRQASRLSAAVASLPSVGTGNAMILPFPAARGTMTEANVLDTKRCREILTSALGRVPRSKRPVLNPALFDAYARWYPGWTVALCCFNNRRARLADTLLWWYTESQESNVRGRGSSEAWNKFFRNP